MKTAITMLLVLFAACGVDAAPATTSEYRCTQQDQDNGTCPNGGGGGGGGSCIPINRCTESDVGHGCCASESEWDAYITPSAAAAAEAALTAAGYTIDRDRPSWVSVTASGQHVIFTYVIGGPGFQCDYVVVIHVNPDGSTSSTTAIGNCHAI